MNIIEKRSGIAFTIKKGDKLKVTDISGQQVSDLVIFNAHDKSEALSAGKTMDFEESILITQRNYLWSNRGNKLMKILEDTNGRNDILLAPCSPETFAIMYDDIPEGQPSCLGNLAANLEPFGISRDEIPTAFNIFMNVQFTKDGQLSVDTPTSHAGDYVLLEALEDLIVGLTACSAPDSNGGSFKTIGYEIL
ncbi:urea carboxylase-associated protein [Nonlabens spongiae]|uniref:Urea carboxylase-associated protein n=1 Tax=Nonlabens spongiae TaxID=331648 RepID=A0A1W6MP26_9FLAO|nr:urea carboxylase-associated family protein [Nonlabens spongiae]ARN79327.1 urea carboxylase-associated protein [Nonlabens spongiae]